MKDFISDVDMNKATSPNFISDTDMDKNTILPEWAPQGLDTAANAVMYNSNKLGAGMAAGVSNIGEAVGVDMNASRDVQSFYQDNAKQYNQPDHPFIQEAYNPLNYTVGGKGAALAGSLVGSAFANEGANSATTGEDFNLGDASTQAAVGLGITSAIPLVGQGANAVKNSFVKSGGKSASEIEQLQQLASKYNIELTPATTTGSPALARMEHNLGDSAAAGFGLRGTVNTEREGAEGAIIGALDRMGANGSNTNAGEMFAQGTKEVIDNEKQYFSDEFSKLFATYGDAPIFSIKGVKNEANKLVNMAERNPIIKNTTAYRDAKALASTDSYLTWADWSKLRTHLGGLTQDIMTTGKASTGAYKQMYAQLEPDLKATVSNTGDSAMKARYDQLIGEYKVFKKDFDGQGSGARFVNSIARDKQSPESIGNSINSSTLKAKGALAAGGFNRKTNLPAAKKVAATDVLLGSRTADGTGISMRKFVKNSEKEGFKKVAEAPDLMLKVKSKDLPQVHILDDVTSTRKGAPVSGTAGMDSGIMSDLGKVAKAIAAKNSYKNNSKTAIYNQINWMKANPISATLMFAKDIGLSTAYRSDMFKRWLSKGYITRSAYQTGIDAIRKGGINKKATATNLLLNTNDDKPKTARDSLLGGKI